MMTSAAAESVALVDAHCHLDLYQDPVAAVEEAERRHVFTIAVTNIPSVFHHTANLARDRVYVRAAAGLHPELVDSHGHELPLLWPLLQVTRYVGEIGLDYSQGDANAFARQRRVFSEILERCALHRGKILTIHSRRAHKDTVEAIGDRYPGRVILHWYTGTLRELERALAYGFYFSVNSAMAASDKGRRILAALPQDRILTETDGPLLKIDGQAARPEQTALIVEHLAGFWRVDPVDARKTILTNFRRLLEESEPAE